jgi:UDP-N-acetyl-2-amino-2-deoxyglucuronate dehydrogenase
VTREFRFAIIGCGVISERHVEQIAAIDGARLVAVVDIVEEKACKLAEKCGVDWYTDYKQMLKRDDIDIVNILTPSGMHADMAIDAARAGKHVIAEKPMDITLDKAHAMIAACRDAGVKLAVISQHRFDPSTVRIKKSIYEGNFGNLVLGQAAVNWYRSQGYYDSGDWRGTWELDGGGALMNQGIHTVDILQYLMGPVESVHAHIGTLAHERIEVEDVAVASVKFKNGALGTIVGTTSAYPGFSARIEVFGTKGTAVIDKDILTQYYLRAEGEQGAMYGRGPATNLAEVQEKDGATGAADPAAISGDSHRLQILDMIQAIKEDREPMVNGEEALKPLEIILAIYKSAQTGEKVNFS